MTFYDDFWQVLRWRPWQALLALYWHWTRRRIRAHNCLRRNWHEAPWAYHLWTAQHEGNEQLAAKIASAQESWHTVPRISIILDAASWTRPGSLESSIKSIVLQQYANWELLLCHRSLPLGFDANVDPRVQRLEIADDDVMLEAALEKATGDFFLPLPPEGQLPVSALLRYLSVLQSHPEAVVVYGDQDIIDEQRRRRSPWWKPEWNRELFLSQDYISAACIIDTASARALLPLSKVQLGNPVYALLLGITRAPSAKVAKVPHVQCHLAYQDLDIGQSRSIKVVQEHLEPDGAIVNAGRFGSSHVLWPLPQELPLVSIIVPTRDKVGLLRACVESVLERTTYSNFEILVVDNNSEEQETESYLCKISRYANVRVLRDCSPYNYSAINNRAVRSARGEFICLLNNDTEVVAPEWLTEMMRQAVRSHVGAVGAKLLYSNGLIQHAGVVIGMGNAAGHAHRGQPDAECGYFAQAHVARNVTAVTAACLVVARDKFNAVGGLDADGLAIAYNDVDLCLKLGLAGWTNVYASAAVLYHHESVSRGNDLSPIHRDRYNAELAVLQERWGTRTAVDPLHHPMLDRSVEQYVTLLRTDLA